MRIEATKECLWVHQLWLIEEIKKQDPDLERVYSLRQVVEALTAAEPTEEQRQILQRLAV